MNTTTIRWSAVALAALAGAGPVRAQCETNQLTDSVNPPVIAEFFGNSVAMSGNILVVGAMGATSGGFGRAYVYVHQFGGWSLAAALKPTTDQGGCLFGAAVAISETGNTIAVGAQGYDHSSLSDPGNVFVYVQPAGGWVGTLSPNATLKASAPANGDNLGTAVAVTDARVLGGAPGNFSGGTGRALVFEKPAGGWAGTLTQNVVLTPTGGGANAGYGSAVALGFPPTDSAFVGSPFHDESGFADCGAVFVYAKSGSTWPLQQKLTAAPNAVSLGLGFSIAVGGSTSQNALIGAPGHAGSQGCAYYFDRSGTTWSQIQQVVASDGAALDDFGSAVALDGNHAYIGARGDDDLGSGSGSAYLFDRSAAGISQMSRLTASNGVAGDGFGRGIAAASGALAVGATGVDVGGAFSAGAAYIFELFGQVGTPYCFCNSGPCANNDVDAGCFNASGANGARMIGCGTASVTLDNLVLQSTGVNPNVNGLMFMGSTQASAPFYNGLLCAGGGLLRFPGHNADSLGLFTEGPGIVAHVNSVLGAGTIVPGVTKEFQLWYRDSLGPCGQGANTTNGVQVVFF